MMKRFAPTMGALTLLIGAFVGCSDAPVTSSGDPGAVNDPYEVFKPNTELLDTYGEIPTLDDALDMNLVEAWYSPSGEDSTGNGRGPRDTANKPPKPPLPPRDTNNHPPRDTTVKPPRDTNNHPPRDTTVKPPRDTNNHPPRDTAKRPPLPRPPKGRPPIGNLNPSSYQRIIKALNLTREQDAAIRLCFQDYRECVRAQNATYNEARRAAFNRLMDAIAEVRAALEAGDITREEAIRQVTALQNAYRERIAELTRAFKAGLQDCENEFKRCVRSHLTREQIAIWERLTNG